MGFWRSIGKTIAENPISTFAVLCVAAIGAFLGYMTQQMVNVLESPDWCSRAIDAERISPGSTYVGLTTCVQLLTIQLQAVATGFHISTGSFAFTLIVLIVVVVAGARASGKLGAGGMEFDVSRDSDERLHEAAAAGAAATAAAADHTADVIASQGSSVIPGRPKDDGSDAAKFTPPPGEQL